MPRFFTLSQAERLLPTIEKILREALSFKTEMQRADEDLKKITQQIVWTGGMRVDQEYVGRLQERKNHSQEQLTEKCQRIQDEGCLIKDLEIGLLDFPTVYQGQEVYLCYKLGESGIRFWHGIDEGFRGRKPIDKEFRESHRDQAP
jgi:hypothetical protein